VEAGWLKSGDNVEAGRPLWCSRRVDNMSTAHREDVVTVVEDCANAIRRAASDTW